jgi:hypothetical protein
LAARSVRAPDRDRAALGLGACGVLGSMLVLFYAGTYSEGQAALAAWVLVGLGVAQFAHRREDADATQAAPKEPATPVADQAPPRGLAPAPGVAAARR